MDKKDLKKLKNEINPKWVKIKKWIVGRALPVAIFAVVSITLISLLIWNGIRPISSPEVDLGGGACVNSVLNRPPNSNLPPIQSPPPLVPPHPNPTPEVIDVPMPEHLLDNTVYSLVLVQDFIEFSIRFDIQNRTARMDFYNLGAPSHFYASFIPHRIDELWLYTTCIQTGFFLFVTSGSVYFTSRQLFEKVGFVDPLSTGELRLFA